MEWWGVLLIGIGALLVGAVVGFLVARKIITNQIEKNPPITEKTIRAMFLSMGRTPSEKQVRQVMASVKNNK